MNNLPVVTPHSSDALALTYTTPLSIEPPPTTLYPLLSIESAVDAIEPISIDPPAYNNLQILPFCLNPFDTSTTAPAVRSRTIRPPTPNQPGLYPPLPPIKRARSADSPPTSTSPTSIQTLTHYYSEETLPNEKRNRLVDDLILYKYAVESCQSSIKAVQLQISQSTDKKQTSILVQQIQHKKTEHKTLKKQLKKAEKQIAQLESNTTRLQLSNEATARTANFHTNELAEQLQITFNEKAILASNLQLSLATNADSTARLQDALTTFSNKELSFQSESAALHKQISSLQSQIKISTALYKTQLDNITVENQTIKRELAEKELLLAESQQNLSSDKANLADADKELTDINLHYKQSLVANSILSNENTSLKADIQSRTTELSNVNQNYAQLLAQYKLAQQQLTSIVPAFTHPKVDHLEHTNTQLRQTLERVNDENKIYETTIKNLKGQIADTNQTESVLHRLKEEYLSVRNSNAALTSQVATLQDSLLVSQLANDQAIKILNERSQHDQIEPDSPSTDSDQPMISPSPQPQISEFFLQPNPEVIAPPVMADALQDLITALNRREDTQAISSFSGNATDQYISSWLSEAEAIAIIHNWNDDVKRQNFASRLKGPALKWHSQRTRAHPNEAYAAWKQALKDHFKHPADRDKQIQKLENLTQKPNQPVRMFIEKINSTYNAIYDDTTNNNLSIKNDLLVKILLRGILKPIKTLMVLNQMLPEVTTWDDAQRAALRCETTLYKTQTNNGVLELPTFTISNIDALSATTLQQQQIKELQSKLNKINFVGEVQEPTDDTIHNTGPN
jgi:hypothetical protein